MMNHQRIVVIGGCNMDISATSYTELVLQDSNPGHIKTTFGGVGRNIAENLVRLGHDVSLIAPLGDDAFGKHTLDFSTSIGINVSHCRVIPGQATSSYLCINYPSGDIAVAVAAMDICESLTPEWLAEDMAFINTFDYVVTDANVPLETLQYLAEHCKPRLCADTVSTKKADRLRYILPNLYFLKANHEEAEVLSGYPLDDQYSLFKALRSFHANGVKRMAITMGKEGALLSASGEQATMPPLLSPTVNSTGCGDAFFAGVLHGMIQDVSIKECLRYGLGMASLCAESEEAVSPILTPALLQNKLND